MTYKETTYHNLTHPQKRIWYIDQINLASNLHNIGGNLNINGAININIMKKAINLIIKNNEGMRLRFTEIDSKPMQYITKFEEQEIDFLDFSTYPNPKKEYQKWATTVFKKSFNLSNEHLFYFAIYKTSNKNYGILFKIHHIISDGWSIALIQNQACELYTKLIHSQEITFNENHTYTNFINSEEKYITSKRFTKNKDFWTKKLKNPPPEFLYNSAVSVAGVRSSIEINTQLSTQIKDFIHHKKCSLNTFFTAAMLIYINKTTNEKDIIMGTGVFNRTNRVQRNTIGMFTSTMPLRFLLNTELTAGELTDQLNNELKACFLNQKYPYDLIVQDLELNKSGHDSLFRMTINYYNMTIDKQIDGMEVTVNEHYNGNQSYSMQLIVREWAEKNIELDFDYKTAEYTEAEIKAMQKAIINIVKQLMNEKMLVKNIQLAADNEINDRLYNFNLTENHYPKKTVTELFEEQVAKHPHKDALEFEDKVITYQELNKKANQLANYLLDKGVSKKTLVSVLITHSPEVIISILAILKTGSTYLPIDPGYPIGRINQLMSDSGSEYLLINVKTDNLNLPANIINITKTDFSSYCSKNPPNKNCMDDLAYIIYTSGSTGTPKGVMIKHKGLTNYIYWASKKYFINESETMALYSSIAFDLTVTSIFTPLIAGKKIAIYNDDDAEFVLYRILRENKATIIKLTPAHLALLKGLDYKDSKVKRLIVGGDDLKVCLAKEINEIFGGVEVYNEYGPTETVVGCMIHQYDEKADTALSVPIGHPVANTQIYILNEDLNMMPVGLPGELYISGDGTALGYLNNVELTLEKFIKNPFIPGQRMYKTGDMARYLENGSIEYIGRTDKQVKIRGHRVELGEIERCLSSIAGVENAVVVLNNLLNAYVVAEGNSEEELKQKLSEMLPRYMMPTNFIFMDQLPLTINGKIDLDSLPDPEAKEKELEVARTKIEEDFVDVLSEVLAIEHISMNDNFYQLGGDSITAIQISSRLINIGYIVKAKDILNYETVKEIAAVIEIADNEVIDQGMASGSFPLTPIMKWFFEQKFTNENHYNQSIVLKIANFDMDKTKKALANLVRHHDALRLNYDRSSGMLYYNNEFSDADIKVDYFDLSICASDEQDQQVDELGFNLKAGLDIENGLLFKAGAFNLGERGHVLLLSAHHLVVDGVSWRIILEDLDYLLSEENNQDVKLPLKTHPFMVWANWLNGEYLKKSFNFEKVYWEDTLAHDFKYSFEFDRGPNIVGYSSTLSVELSVEKTKELLTVVNDVYSIGVHETLAVALSTIINDLTGQDEIVIELEGHGREEMDSKVNISRTVGWFTSLYPVRLRMAGDDLDGNIKSLKEQIRRVPNKGFDFGVMKYLKKEFADQGESYVRFNYLGNYESGMRRNSFEIADVGYEFDTDQRNKLTAILDINAVIVDGKLIITCGFSRNKFSEERIWIFLDKYVERIGEIIELCNTNPGKKFTPSDFSASDISQDDLDSLFG